MMTHVSTPMTRVLSSLVERAVAFHRTKALTARTNRRRMYHRRQAELIARRRALLIEERFVKSDASASEPEHSPAYRVALDDWTRKIERLRANEGMSLAEASETIGSPPIPEN